MVKRFWGDRVGKDNDGDGLSDDFEYVVGTNPQLRDTDDDRLNHLRERDFGPHRAAPRSSNR
jgi:Bacterial TSP3 repeat